MAIQHIFDVFSESNFFSACSFSFPILKYKIQQTNDIESL
jgi:hypothetical protein